MPRKTEDKFMLRLPDGWRSVIKAKAERDERSMNFVILKALGPMVQAEKSKASGAATPTGFDEHSS